MELPEKWESAYSKLYRDEISLDEFSGEVELDSETAFHLLRLYREAIMRG